MTFVTELQLRDTILRSLTVQYLGCSDALVIEELGLRHGAARIDIAVVTGRLHGYELKSDYDTLARLPVQTPIYNSVLDLVTLVIGRYHLIEALSNIPEWWGLTLAEMQLSGQVMLSEIRRPRTNPSVDLLAVTKLLWRNEALSILDEMGHARGARSKPRALIYAKLVQVAEPSWLKARVYSQLRCRTNWRSESQRVSYDD